MVMATLDNWRVVEATVVLHWFPDPYCKGNMQVMFLQGANIDPQNKVLIGKVKACHITPCIYFSLAALSPREGQQ